MTAIMTMIMVSATRPQLTPMIMMRFCLEIAGAAVIGGVVLSTAAVLSPVAVLPPPVAVLLSVLVTVVVVVTGTTIFCTVTPITVDNSLSIVACVYPCILSKIDTSDSHKFYAL